MRRIVLTVSMLVLLAACAVSRPLEASREQFAASSAYVPEGPPKLTLFTVISNNSESGGHTALMVSGSQQVIFDPAGSFKHFDIVERGDVLYGMTPAWVAAYKSAHARSTHHIVSQEIVVSPAQAELALELVTNNGSVLGAFCARSTSSILRQIPGFTDVEVTFFPVNLMKQIGRRPDVTTDRYYENDIGDVSDGIVSPQVILVQATQRGE